MKRTQDEVVIQEAYIRMCEGMIAKDERILRDVLDDSFVLIHMTGMRQSKEAFLQAVLDGTLNYFSARHDSVRVELSGNSAVLTGQSYVSAAVFDGGRHNWRLQQRCSLIRRKDGWKITESTAGTY